jgi:hypothetical protein
MVENPVSIRWESVNLQVIFRFSGANSIIQVTLWCSRFTKQTFSIVKRDSFCHRTNRQKSGKHIEEQTAFFHPQVLPRDRMIIFVGSKLPP